MEMMFFQKSLTAAVSFQTLHQAVWEDALADFGSLPCGDLNCGEVIVISYF